MPKNKHKFLLEALRDTSPDMRASVHKHSEAVKFLIETVKQAVLNGAVKTSIT